MKKLLAKQVTAILIILTLILSFSSVAFTQDMNITVFLNGEQLTFDVDPTLESGRTLVPMRAIFEALGAEVTWVNETQTAIATKDNLKIEISIDNTQMLKNGEVITLDVPARLINSRTLVPVRAVSEGMGAKVDWDNANQRVLITTPEPVATEPESATPEASEPETETPEITEPTEAEKIQYDFTELSPQDTEFLVSSLNQIRYSFEQQILLHAFLEDKDFSTKLINSKDKELPDIVSDIWNSVMINVILEIQINSGDTYMAENEDIDEITEEILTSVYLNIAKSANVDANSIFTVDYAATPSKKNVLLLTFKTADEPLNCKYIGIVVQNSSISYFTAETTVGEYAANGYMFCEVEEASRGNYGVQVKTLEEFLKEIDNALKN